jgi:hypothetical protein
MGDKTVDLRHMIAWKSGLAKMARNRGKQRRHRRLHLEVLEPRRVLANLTATDFYLLDSDGNRFDAPPSEGDLALIAIEFQTEGLPGIPHQVEWCLNEICNSTSLDWGTGVEGYGWWIFIWWIGPVPGGENVVRATLDAYDVVEETDESDNTKGLSFLTPDAPDPIFLNPVGGVPVRDWGIGNYVDLDPGPGLLDYHGGTFTYNGHDAHDTSDSSSASRL